MHFYWARRFAQSPTAVEHLRGRSRSANRPPVVLESPRRSFSVRWTAATKERLVFAFLDELGPEALNQFDRFLATAPAEEKPIKGEGK
jgi:hypothetical protein